MKLLQRLLLAAIAAGFLAGIAMTVIQQWKVTPLIYAAEAYEVPSGGEATADAAWAPQGWLERIAYTVLANLLACIGFALALGAVSIFTGIAITPVSGLVWGLAGYVAFELWPALGLPPSLPGMAAADLVPRQIWWWVTALLAVGAFVLVAKRPGIAAIGAAAGLLLLPHLVGAPQPPTTPSGVPAVLAAQYVAAALATNAVFWLTLGPLLGWFSDRAVKTKAGLHQRRAGA